MAFHLTINYRGAPVIYEVIVQENNVYQLHLHSKNNAGDEYIPEKIIIRQKGKIWISDMDNYDELIDALTHEIIQFGSQT